LPTGHPHIEEATDAFLALDENGDNVLSGEEFKKGLRRFPELQELFKDAYWDEEMLFEAADRTSSGSLNAFDFFAATLPPSVLREEKNLYQVFRAFDQDEDGEITIDEVLDAVKMLDGILLPPEAIQQLCEAVTIELDAVGIVPDLPSLKRIVKTKEQLEEDGEGDEDEDWEDEKGKKQQRPAPMRCLDNCRTSCRVVIPPYRHLDFGEFVYLIGSAPRQKHCPYNCGPLCEKEGKRALYKHTGFDMYKERRNAAERVLKWPPRPGSSAQTAYSVQRQRGGLVRKRRGK